MILVRKARLKRREDPSYKDTLGPYGKYDSDSIELILAVLALREVKKEDHLLREENTGTPVLTGTSILLSYHGPKFSIGISLCLRANSRFASGLPCLG